MFQTMLGKQSTVVYTFSYRIWRIFQRTEKSLNNVQKSLQNKFKRSCKQLNQFLFGKKSFHISKKKQVITQKIKELLNFQKHDQRTN